MPATASIELAQEIVNRPDFKYIVNSIIERFRIGPEDADEILGEATISLLTKGASNACRPYQNVKNHIKWVLYDRHRKPTSGNKIAQITTYTDETNCFIDKERSHVDNTDNKDEVTYALSALSPDEKTIVVGSVVDELTYNEISTKLHFKRRQTIGYRKKDALDLMREIILT